MLTYVPPFRMWFGYGLHLIKVHSRYMAVNFALRHKFMFYIIGSYNPVHNFDFVLN